MNWRRLPNAISLLRIIVVAPVVWSILQHDDLAALTLISIAGVSDAMDGLLAKRFGWVTHLGTILDPLADKVFMAGSFLAAVWVGLVPLWLTALVITRDAVIIAGALVYHWRVGVFQPQPSVLSKVNTFLQISLVLTVVAGHYTALVPPSAVMALVAAVALTTLTSGVDYMIRWGRRIAHAPAQEAT